MRILYEYVYSIRRYSQLIVAAVHPDRNKIYRSARFIIVSVYARIAVFNTRSAKFYSNDQLVSYMTPQE